MKAGQIHIQIFLHCLIRLIIFLTTPKCIKRKKIDDIWDYSHGEGEGVEEHSDQPSILTLVFLKVLLIVVLATWVNSFLEALLFAGFYKEKEESEYRKAEDVEVIIGRDLPNVDIDENNTDPDKTDEA